MDVRFPIAGGYSDPRGITICVHCAYEEITRDGFLFKTAQASIGHNLLEPWVVLHQYGLENGIRFVTADQVGSLEVIDAVVFSDRPAASDTTAQALLALEVPKYLQLCETPMIKPDNWDRSYHARFDRIFTTNDDYVDQVRYLKSYHAFNPGPVEDITSQKVRFGLRKLCTLIAGGKLTQHPQELYSHRIAFIRWMEAHAPADFDLYGVGWPAEHFPSYRGKLDDKLTALRGYRFALCYENAHSYPGYITEKLFDCFVAGVVPIYWGAPNIARYVPADCYIDRTRFASDAEVYAHIRAMSEAEHGAYLDRIAAFIASPEIYPFTIENFITTLTATVVRDVKARRGAAPRLSVCIPNYNYGKYLGKAIDSVLAQEEPGLELLIFDNGSSDNSSDVLAQYRQHPGVRVMRNSRNYGPAVNWRNAFRCAAGRYITVLSADDYFLPGHLARGMAVLDAHPGLGMYYTPCLRVDAEGVPQGTPLGYGHRANDYVGQRDEVADLLTYDCYITPSAAILHSETLTATGLPEIGLRAAGDWFLWILMAMQTPDFGFSARPGVAYRWHAAQHTQSLRSNTHFLEDHILILDWLLAQGHEARLAEHASEISALLTSRYLTAPRPRAQAFLPRILDIEVRLLNAWMARHVPATLAPDLRQHANDALSAALRNELPVVQLIDCAEALVAAGQAPFAITLYRTWVTHTNDSQRYVGAFNLGIALRDAGQLTQARMYLEHAVMWKPGFELARQALATLPPR